MRSLFITGASGFIGSAVIRNLDLASWEHVYCLRHHAPISGSSHPKFHYISAGLDNADHYAPYLEQCNTVLHLAAATGNVPAQHHLTVNARGTESLIEQCERAGVKNFLFVSTIAVKYRDLSHYAYAQSKLQAENALKSSHLNYCIVRPTIVIGKAGATWKALSKIGRLPMPFVFGTGKNRIQPILVDDLAQCLVNILQEDALSNNVIELGGPEYISFQEFIQRIHFHYYHRQARVLHIPPQPISALLSVAARYFPSSLPLNAGQLSAFTNDSTIESNRIFVAHSSCMKTIDQMLTEVVCHVQ